MRVLVPLGAAANDAAAVAACCRPFAAERNGFALGEAAAAFVLESPAHAAARGARVDAMLAGYATNCDGVHITQPDAAGQARAMQAALADAGLAAATSATSTPTARRRTAGDAAEAESIARVFGPGGVPVSSTKAIHGHLLGAGGAVELLAALRALGAGRLPPTANVDAADPAFAIDLVLRRGAPGRRPAGGDVQLVRLRRHERGADRLPRRLGPTTSPCANPWTRRAESTAGRLAYLPVSLFGSVMALCGLALAWRLAATEFGLPAWIGEALGLIAAGDFVALTVAYGIKCVDSPAAVRAEFAHPVAANFFATPLISLLLLPAVVGPYAVALARPSG